MYKVTEDIANGSNENVKATVKKCLLYSLFFGSISSLAICILAPFLSNVILHNQVSSLPFYAISISLPFVAMSSCINGYFSAVRHVAKSAFVQILEQIIKIFSISFFISRFMPSTVDFTIISLVLGDSHSIGVPLAVSTDYSFIAPTATMIIHPVRMNGTIIGAPQTFDYFKMIQDRIVRFISSHSKVSEDELEKMMMNTGILTKDLGTILVGQEAVDKGLVNGVGGIKEAFAKMQELMNEKGKEHD